MGCSSSILGSDPERERRGQRQPIPARELPLTPVPTDIAPAVVRPRRSPLQYDGSRPQGLDPEKPKSVPLTAGGPATGLRSGSPGAVVQVTEDLASGRSQLERGYQNLPLGVPLKDWDDMCVRMWLRTLPQVLRQYTDMLCSPGGLLLEWSDELLIEAGVSNIFHRKQLLEYVRQLQADVTACLNQYEGTGTPVGLIPGSIDSPHANVSDGSGLGHGGGKPAGWTALLSSCKPDEPQARDSDQGTSHRGAGGGTATSQGDDWLEEYKEGRVELGLSNLKLLVREAGSMCPWPGSAAAKLLSTLLDLGEKALINRRNWQQLNTRAVDLLQLIASNQRLQADTHTYRSIMHRLINTLKGIREYYTDYTNRNWLLRIVGVGQDQHMFTQLWNALGALVADASLGLQAGAAAEQETAAKVLARLEKRQARYDDEEGRLRARIEQVGIEALLRDPAKLDEVAKSLGIGEQLTLHKIQEAVGLLEADRSEGVHSLIPHPDLRVMWRKCFASLQDVKWDLWWAVFPTELSRVPVEQLVITELSSILTSASSRCDFQRRLDLSASGRISVVDLRRSVPAEADLRDVVTQLTEPLSMDGGGVVRGGGVISLTGVFMERSANPSARATKGAGRPEVGKGLPSAAPEPDSQAQPQSAGSTLPPEAAPDGDTGFAVASRPVPKALSTSAPAPYIGLEPRCSLPPLDSDCFVGRKEDVQQVSSILLTSFGGNRQRRRTSDTGRVALGGDGNPGIVQPPLILEDRAGSEAGSSTTKRSADVQDRRVGIQRSYAVCIVAESGMGKSALAVATARRLWNSGCLPGGAYYVDLQGADCRTELVARFASALGLPKADHSDATSIAGVSLALQALAARGDLLLVLDGVDCLGDANDSSKSAQYPLKAAKADVNDTADDSSGAGVQGDGDDGGGLGTGHDTEAEAVLSELLALVPSSRVLLTSTEPLELRSREVKYFWLGPLPEPAAVALVQETARCLSSDEARQLVGACGMSPLALRLAASAVAAGTLTLQEAMACARNATALLACMPQPLYSPGCNGTGSGNATTAATTPLTGKLCGGGTGPSGPSIFTLTTPILLLSQSPVALPPNRYPSTQTPTCKHRVSGSSVPAYEWTRRITDGSGTGEGSAAAKSPGPNGGGVTDSRSSIHGPPLPSPSNMSNARPNASFGRSMSFLLRASQNISGAAASNGSSTLPPYLQQTFSTRGGGSSGRTYGSGTVVAAALLAALNEEHRMALVQLSIMPGSWDEDAASALLAQPPYAVRALLDVLLGYSLIVSRSCKGSSSSVSSGLGTTMGGYGQGCYSLMPGVMDAARAQLAELDTEDRVALQCRFVGHVLSQFLRADRLYRDSAVRAAMQLASEQRQDVQAMLLVGAKCSDPERMLWGTIGVSRLATLGTSPLFSALVLDTSAEMEAFWRTVADSATAIAAAPAGATPATETGRYEALAALAARVLAQMLHKKGRYEEAEMAWRGALMQAQRIHGPGSLEAAACHGGLGLALSALRQYGEAEKQHEEALRLRKAVLGDRHADVATSLSDLARVMRNSGRYREAEAAYKEVLKVRRELLGMDHPSVADTYTSTGIVAGLQKRYMEEEYFYRKALAIRKRILGPEHPEVAQALNNIGTALSSQRKHVAAEQVFREALSIKRKVLGPSHHAVGTTLNNIARALRYQGELAKAEACCRQALAVLESSLGVTHPSVTTAVSNLIFLLKRQGKDAEGAAVDQAYRPRWTQQDQAAQAPNPPGDEGQVSASHMPQAEIRFNNAIGGAVVGIDTTGSPSLRLGKPPLAPQGNAPTRTQQQKQQQSEQCESQMQAKEQRRAPVLRPRPLDIPATASQGPRGQAEGSQVFAPASADAKSGLELGTCPHELNVHLEASSLQRDTLVESARTAQQEMQVPAGVAAIT